MVYHLLGQLFGDVPAWVSDWFPIIQIVLIVSLMVLAVGLIVCILFQSSTSSGMGAIAGQSTETFYSKNKGKSLQGLLKRLTIVFAISILVVSVLYLLAVLIYPVNI